MKCNLYFNLNNILEEEITLPRSTIQNNKDLFEFQGSFGGEQLYRKFEQEGIRDITNTQKRLQLPKISLDSVLDMQKSESFVNRCN